jgi:hypothetical protein
MHREAVRVKHNVRGTPPHTCVLVELSETPTIVGQQKEQTENALGSLCSTKWILSYSEF